MATTAEYLNKLVTQKNTLADNLVTKGVSASHDETLETLVPKVLEISGGGGGDIYPIDTKTGLPYGDVTVSEGITALVKTFQDNKAITSVKLPKSLKTIGDYAFSSCENLASIDFNNVEKIGRYALERTGLINVILPETLTEIGERAFYYCNYLTKLYIPASCISIHNTNFVNVNQLTDITVGVGFSADLTIRYMGNNKLTAETINGIIANYADNSGKTLTMGNTYLAKLTDEDKAVASAKGLTLA